MALPTSVPDTCNSLNIALNKPAIASSVYGTQYPASAALDGDPNTRWSSEFSDPQYIYVDLGKRYDICSVVLKWETAFGQDFKNTGFRRCRKLAKLANFTGNASTINIIHLKGTEDM